MQELFDFQRFTKAVTQLIPYFYITLQIVLVAVSAGSLLGLLVAVLRIKKIPVIHHILSVYISFMRGTPMIIQMLLIYYALPGILWTTLGIDIGFWQKLTFVELTFVLNEGAFLGEIFRSAIEAVPYSQTEAGYSVGLTGFQTFLRIVLPQALRIALPAYGVDVIGIFHNTSIAFMLGVVDMIGGLIGLLIAIVRTYKVPVLSQIFFVFVSMYQGIPFVVSIMIYNLIFMSTFNDFAAAIHWNKTLADVNLICVGYFSLILFCAVSISETFRGAFKAVPESQYEAGYSIGLTKIQTLYRIIIPQMLPVAMPGLTNNMVGTIKATALVTAVGIVEVMSGAVIPCGITYSFMEGYAAAAVIYWVFSEIISFILKSIEKRSNLYRRRGTA